MGKRGGGEGKSDEVGVMGQLGACQGKYRLVAISAAFPPGRLLLNSPFPSISWLTLSDVSHLKPA